MEAVSLVPAEYLTSFAVVRVSEEGDNVTVSYLLVTKHMAPSWVQSSTKYKEQGKGERGLRGSGVLEGWRAGVLECWSARVSSFVLSPQVQYNFGPIISYASAGKK
ncbi:hypothetical protein ACMFMG_008981 [Clarireedia jacksonii]